MAYAVKWTENDTRTNRIVKRELNCLTKDFAVVMLNRIIINCHHYDAVLVTRKD